MISGWQDFFNLQSF